MGMGDGDGLAAGIEDEATVAVEADDVAREAGKESGGDADEGVVAGVVFKGSKEDADTLGVNVGQTHEGMHLAVGNSCHAASGVVVAETMAGKIVIEIALQLLWIAFQEDEAADGGSNFLACPLGVIFVGDVL